MELWLREKESEKKLREKKKREKRLAVLLQLGASASHYFTLSSHGHPLVTTITSTTRPPHSPTSSWRSFTKIPFVLAVISLTSSQLWSCMNISTGKIQIREKQGWDAEKAGGWWGPRRRNHLSQIRESGHVTPEAKTFVWQHGRLNGVFLCSKNCKKLEARLRDTYWNWAMTVTQYAVFLKITLNSISV